MRSQQGSSLRKAIMAMRERTNVAKGLTLRQAYALCSKKVLDHAAELHLFARNATDAPSPVELLESSEEEVLLNYLRTRQVTGFRPADVQPTTIAAEWLESARFDIGANEVEGNGLRITGIRVLETNDAVSASVIESAPPSISGAPPPVARPKVIARSALKGSRGGRPPDIQSIVDAWYKSLSAKDRKLTATKLAEIWEAEKRPGALETVRKRIGVLRRREFVPV